MGTIGNSSARLKVDRVPMKSTARPSTNGLALKFQMPPA
jgi:hypothetical protein